jgi:hypothetical protein
MAGVKGKGGQKGRSGRKPKAFTMLKQRIESEKVEDAEYAITLYVSVMRDEEQPLDLRLDCAEWVANRVMGLPKARNENDNSGTQTIRVEYVKRPNGAVNGDAPSADANPERSEAV